MDFEYGQPYSSDDANKSIDQIAAESRSPDPIGPVFQNDAGDVIVEIMWADETHVHFLRLRKDRRRMKGRKEMSQMTHERFEEIYSPVS